MGDYLHPPVEEGYSWRQVRVVHFTAVLTAITQGLLRTPNEELRASSAGVNKHQRALTVNCKLYSVKPAFFGNNSSFLANKTFSSFHLNSIILFFSSSRCVLSIYLFISFSLTLLLSFFLSLVLSIILSFCLILPTIMA